MKKYLLLCTALTVASSAQAADLNCATPPSCTELGYTMTATDCAGKFTLKCPFDNSKIFCTGNTSGGDDVIEDDGSGTQIECVVGSMLYDDLKCYALDDAPDDKDVIAVVFDATNRLAIGLNDAPSTMKWSSTAEDIAELTNYSSSSTALASTESGYYNTLAIIRLAGDYSSSNYAPGYCLNSTAGGFIAGRWWLPSLKELKAIYDNKDTINTALENAGGTALSNSYYWSFTEYASTSVWQLSMYNGTMNYYGKTGPNDHVRCVTSFF